jgi:hypothetical protein
VNAKLSAALDVTLAVLSSPVAGAIDPKVPEGAQQLRKLLSVLQAGTAAYEQATGKPIDMALLHQIEPLPVPPEEPEDAEGEPV